MAEGAWSSQTGRGAFSGIPGQAAGGGLEPLKRLSACPTDCEDAAGDGTERRLRFHDAMECGGLASHRSLRQRSFGGGADAAAGSTCSGRTHDRPAAPAGCAQTMVRAEDAVVACASGGGIRAVAERP